MNGIINNLITVLNDTGRAFCDFSIAMFIQASVLIVLLFVIDILVRKRVRATFRYWIWMLVFIKLVLPPALSLPTGIGNWFGEYFVVNSTDFKSNSDNITQQETEPVQSAGIAGTEFSPQQIQTLDSFSRPAISEVPELPKVSASSEAILQEKTAVIKANILTWQGGIFLIWLVGVLVLSVLLIQRIFFVKGLIAQSEPAKNRLLETLQDCSKQLGIRRSIGMKLSHNASSPAVCGLFKPVILIPVNLLNKISHDKFRAILIHELSHIKRADLWVNCAQTILQIFYFYNPLVWLANSIVRRIREQAVDEMVLVALSADFGELSRTEAKSYSNTLIDVAEMAFSRPTLSLRLVGVVESKKALSERIKHILSRPIPKSAKLGFLGLIVIIIAGAILLPMAKKQSNKDDLFGQDILIKFESTSDNLGDVKTVNETKSYSKTYNVKFNKGEKLLIFAELYKAGEPMKIIGHKLFEQTNDSEKLIGSFSYTNLDQSKTATMHQGSVKLGEQIFNIPEFSTNFFPSSTWWGWFNGDALRKSTDWRGRDSEAMEILFYYAGTCSDSKNEAKFWIPSSDTTPVEVSYALVLKAIPLSRLEFLHVELIGGYQGLDGKIIAKDKTVKEAEMMANEYKQMLLDFINDKPNDIYSITLPNGVTVEKVVDAIKNAISPEYYISQIEGNSSPFYHESGNGIGIYINQKGLKYPKQQFSTVIWLMPSDYKGRLSSEDKTPQTVRPRFMAETESFKIYTWPGPTELSKKIVEVIENAYAQIEAENHSPNQIRGDVSWGEPLNGLRVRTAAPKGNIYRKGESLPLTLEIQNVSSQSIPLKKLNGFLDFKVTDLQNERIGVQGYLYGHIIKWASSNGVLEPNEIIKETFYLERFKWRMPSKVEDIKLYFSLPIPYPLQVDSRNLPIVEYCNPITLKLYDSPFEHSMKSGDLPEKWTEDIDIVYREVGGIFMGSLVMHIDGKGKVTIIVDPVNLTLPYPVGRNEYVLGRSELDELMKSLREFEIERLNEFDDKMFATDLMTIHFSLANGGQTFVGKYEVFGDETEAVVALQTLMRELITKIVTVEKPNVQIEAKNILTAEGTEASENVHSKEWGEAVEGVRCHVRPEKKSWVQGAIPKLFADIQNQGQRNLRIALEHESWEIEIDDKWYQTNNHMTGARRYLPLEAGQQQQNLEVCIVAGVEDTISQALQAIEPGKHTLRIARLLNSSRAPGENVLRIISNPVEIEILQEAQQSNTTNQLWRVKTDLSNDVIDKRNALLSQADLKIRSGLLELSKKFPLIKEARDWNEIITEKSGIGQIGISLFHTDRGKAQTTKEPVPESEKFSVLVVISKPVMTQMGMFELYPNLGLVGQVATSSGNPELDSALKKLVTEALEPLKQYDEANQNKAQKILQADVENRKIYLPDLETPDVNVVLDLATGQMLSVKPTEKDERYFEKMGKGDLVYEHVDNQSGLLCLRGVRMELQTDTGLSPLKPDVERDNFIVYFINNVPSKYRVTTAEGGKYDLNILSVNKGDKGGVHIEYRKSDVKIETEKTTTIETTENNQSKEQIILQADVVTIKQPLSVINNFLAKEIGLTNPVNVELTEVQIQKFKEWAASKSGTNIASSPRTITYDGQSTKMSITTSTGYEKQQKDANSPDGYKPVNATIKTGFELELVPELRKAENKIRLKIDIENSEPVEKVSGSGIPAMSKQNISTMVIIPLGQYSMLSLGGVSDLLKPPFSSPPTPPSPETSGSTTFFIIKADTQKESNSKDGRVEFRIAPDSVESSRNPSPLKPEQELRYREDLRQNGPDAGRKRNDEYIWIPVGKGMQFGSTISEEYNGKKHLLVCNREPFILLPDATWELQEINLTNDNNSRLSLTLKFNKQGGDQLYQLTSSNVGKSLAMIVDGIAISAPTIESPVRDKVMIVGNFTIEEILTIIKSLQKATLTENQP